MHSDIAAGLRLLQNIEDFAPTCLVVGVHHDFKTKGEPAFPVRHQKSIVCGNLTYAKPDQLSIPRSRAMDIYSSCHRYKRGYVALGL